jgi:hypothetical protein
MGKRNAGLRENAQSRTFSDKKMPVHKILTKYLQNSLDLRALKW